MTEPPPDDTLLLVPIMRRRRPAYVVAVTGTSVDQALQPLTVLASMIGLALDAGQHGWAEAIIEGSQDIMLVLEPDGVVRTANAAVRRILGMAPEALIGGPVVDLVHPDDADPLMVWLTRATDQAHPPAIDVRCRHVDGGWVDMEATATDMLGVADVRGLVVNMRDVRERKTLEAELSHWAFYDPLTNLANRAGIRDRISAVLARTELTGSHPAVLLVDLDDFKAVNDALGHQEGDRLLMIVAERLRHATRTGDALARLGGDEFVVLIDDAVIAENVAERVLGALDDPVTLHGAEVRVHASIGIRVADLPDNNVDQMLRDADLAMYAAKASGKATWRRFHPHMYEQVQEQLTIRAELRRAIERDEFVLHYQPIVELATARIVGFEALIRWNHPDRGLMMPGSFISHAEQGGLIIPIGAWVLRRACETAVAMRRTAGADLFMSVNVSPRQLLSSDIVSLTRDVLRDTGLPGRALCLEITEDVLADDTLVVERLGALRTLGTRLAIDDFGTGFSSYSYLQHLPVDTIKIDRSFVERLGFDEATPALARSIIRMGQALGLQTVAEGVETSAQREQLRALGCQLAQGYLFARPVDKEAALALLAEETLEPGDQPGR
jgi:diguanylate cyclase (GGDEF)-like protein/PAS domain S-box-containing protein